MVIEDKLDNALLEKELAKDEEAGISGLSEEASGEEYLLALGYERGYVTYEDILRVFPEAEEDVDRLDEVIGAIMESGITVGGPDEARSGADGDGKEDEEE